MLCVENVRAVQFTSISISVFLDLVVNWRPAVCFGLPFLFCHKITVALLTTQLNHFFISYLQNMDSDSIEDYLSQNSDMDPIEDDSDAIYEDEIRDSTVINDSGVSDNIKVRNRFSILDTTVIDEPSVSEQSRVINVSKQSSIPHTTTETRTASAIVPNTAKKLTGTSCNSSGRTNNKAVPSAKPNSDNSAVGTNDKVVNVNSTKIIIKGISTMANASSNNDASVTDDEIKNIFPQEKSGMEAEFDLQVKELGDSNLETRQQTSTPKIKREVKQLQKMVNESKILTEFVSDQDSQRSRKVKKTPKADTDHDFSGTGGGDNESIASKSSSRSRSLSRNRSPTDTPVSSKDGEKNRRNMRSQNAEFSAKHYKFLRGIHQHDSDVSDNTSDIEVDKPVPVSSNFEENSKTVHPPPKVNFVC